MSPGRGEREAGGAGRSGGGGTARVRVTGSGKSVCSFYLRVLLRLAVPGTRVLPGHPGAPRTPVLPACRCPRTALLPAEPAGSGEAGTPRGAQGIWVPVCGISRSLPAAGKEGMAALRHSSASAEWSRPGTLLCDIPLPAGDTATSRDQKLQ